MPKATTPLDVDGLIRALRGLLASLPTTPPDLTSLSGARRRALTQEITATIERLSALALALDPVRQPPVVLDPSDPEMIGHLIANTLLEQPTAPLANFLTERFWGSGVYALYYTGTFPTYRPVRGTEIPLYVGKADPAVPRADTVIEQGERLCGRLRDHAKSIRLAENINLDDFHCRFLVVKSAWQNTAETYLINLFKPAWNKEMKVCYGFGKHGDAPTTRTNRRSAWDTIHPGRHWAGEGNQPNELTAEQILARISEHFRALQPHYTDLKRKLA
jgi:hypothetical protein